VAAAAVTALFSALPRPASAQEQDTEAIPPGTNVTTRVFGDVQWRKTRGRDTPNSFALGQFDLFATATLNDRISFLAEVVLEGSVNTRVVTDLERLEITFRLHDSLQVSAGRHHTGVGFYNTAFHHGSYFEIPIGRPRVFDFEDEGGVLPVHDVGVSMRGAVPGTSGAWQYLFEVGNGRNWNLTGPSGAVTEDLDETDTNEAKSINAGLSYRPERWRGLEVGGSYLRDTIPLTPAPDMDHHIAAGYVTYRRLSIEILGEWLELTHQPAGGRRIRNHAAYVQLSRAWGRLRPYYRYDRLSVNPSTPLIGAAGSYRANIAGLRVELGEWAGFKAQYERADDALRTRMNSIRTQLVYVF